MCLVFSSTSQGGAVTARPAGALAGGASTSLPRHRLLREPGGFEGLVKFGASTEHFKPGDPSIADPPQQENWVADASVTARHQARDTPHADDLVATIMKPIDLLTGTRQALPLRSSHSGKPVMTSPRARLNRCGGVDVLDLRIGKGEQALDVLAVPSVHQAANDLDVLLRHHPRSISLSKGRLAGAAEAETVAEGRRRLDAVDRERPRAGQGALEGRPLGQEEARGLSWNLAQRSHKHSPRAGSSVGQSSGLIIRRSQVRVLPGPLQGGLAGSSPTPKARRLRGPAHGPCIPQAARSGLRGA
jgi:hypothetical protein